MAQSPHEMIQGTTSPALRYSVTGIDAIPSGTRVYFRMPPVILEREALILGYGPVEVEHQWQDGDTDQIGTFPGSFRFEYPDDGDEVVPSGEVIPVRIGGSGTVA